MKHSNISSTTDALQEKGYMNSQIPISSEQSGVYSVRVSIPIIIMMNEINI